MSRADIDRFVENLKSDPALLEQVKTGATGLASVVDLAKSKGYDVTIDEAKAYIDEQAHAELSDDQLDAVAGGKGGGSVQANTNVQTNVEAVNNVAGVTNVAGAVDAAAAAAAVVVIVAT